VEEDADPEEDEGEEEKEDTPGAMISRLLLDTMPKSLPFGATEHSAAPKSAPPRSGSSTWKKTMKKPGLLKKMMPLQERGRRRLKISSTSSLSRPWTFNVEEYVDAEEGEEEEEEDIPGVAMDAEGNPPDDDDLVLQSTVQFQRGILLAKPRLCRMRPRSEAAPWHIAKKKGVQSYI
jgi:hypothetical protein